MEQTRHVWREKRGATLKDVAREVGVSESLASFVLNGSSTGTRVSSQTRERVVEAAARMGYRRNSVARTLNTGRTNRLGVYSGRTRLDSRNVYYAEVLGGMFEGARQHGMNVVIHTSGDAAEQLLDLVADRALDGLVVFASAQDPILPVLSERRMPTVAVADRITGIPTICVDDRAGGVMQAAHLYERGHRHILVKLSNPAPDSARVRTDALITQAEAFGIRVTVLDEDQYAPKGLMPEEMGLLTSADDPATAVVGWNDLTAGAAFETLTSAGLRVPEDVAVMGFDGFHHSVYSPFRISTIEAPWAKVGATAAHLLTQLINGESVAAVTTLPVRLLKGTTT